MATGYQSEKDEQTAQEAQQRHEAALYKKNTEAFKDNPFFKEIAGDGGFESTSKSEFGGSFSGFQSTAKKEEKEPLTKVEIAKNTLADAIAKFRTDLKDPNATAASLVKPLLESFSSIKVGENETLEFDNANNIFGISPLKPGEAARLTKLGLPEIGKDLEFMQSALGFNNSYIAGGKQDIEYITKFSDKYAAQMPAFEVQHQAQIAEQAKLAQQAEAARLVANEKSNAEYAKEADERLAKFAAEKAAEPAPIVPEVNTSADLKPRFVQLSDNEPEYKPDLAALSLDAKNIPRIPITIVGQMIVLDKDGNPVLDNQGKQKPNPSMKAPKVMDETFTWLDASLAYIDRNESFSNDQKIVARHEVISQYAGVFDQYKYPTEKLLDSSEFNMIGRNPHKNLDGLAPEIARINGTNSTEPQTAIAPTTVVPPVAPEVIVSSPSSTIQDTLAKLKERASEAEPVPAPSPEILNTLAQLKQRAAEAETAKPKAETVTPEQLSGMVDGLKSVATYAVDKATDKVKHQYERAKGLVEATSEFAGSVVARQQLKANELAANEAKEQARVEALFNEAEKATTPPIAAVLAPAAEPSLATTDFTATIPTEGLVPLSPELQPNAKGTPAVDPTLAALDTAEAGLDKSVEEIVAPTPATTEPETPVVAKADDLSRDENGNIIPKAIIIPEEEEYASVLPPLETAKSSEAINAADEEKRIPLDVIAKEFLKLRNGKDKDDKDVPIFFASHDVNLDQPKSPIIITSQSSTLATLQLMEFAKDPSNKDGLTKTQFAELGAMIEEGIVTDTAGIDDVKADKPLSPTQVRDLTSLAKNLEIAKN